MSRVLLQYLLPLVGPLALYLIYMAFQRRRAAKAGADIPAIERGHVFWSIVAGFVLMMAGLAYIALSTGEAPGAGQYQAPRLEDGRIVPPTFK
jgi:hypothetical protein